MATWFSSDHHFGHKNIIKYCDRPFDSVEEMNEALVEAWNNCVKDDDIVYYLGDFSLKPSEMERYAPRLNGNKILIAGNHDACHPSNHAGNWGHVGRYKEFFLDVVDELEWEDVLLHHMPYHDDDDDRFPDYRPIDSGKILLHGHVHERWLSNGRQINVGVDVWNYEPVHENEIRKFVKEIEESDVY